MSAYDIIEAKLAHLTVTLDSHQPYQWTAKTKVDQMIFSGNGFTPGAAADMLYSIMLQHLDRQADEAKK